MITVGDVTEQASVLRQRYGPEPGLIWRVKGLTVFLLVRT